MKAAPGNELLLAAFQTHQDELILSRLKVACILCIFIVPLAVLMDVVVYPGQLPILAAIRLVCTAIIAALYWKLRRAGAIRNVHGWSQVWVNVMLGYNAALILATNGVLSPYYAGLNLVILGACLLLPWSFREGLAACLASIGWYFVAGGGNWILFEAPGGNWFPVFFNNSFITFSNVAICGTAVYFAAQLRFRDFQLQYELDQKKKELEESYAKLEDLDRAKSQFFANISHELRTPLTLILSPLDVLRADAALTAKARERLDLMSQNGLRLLSLINDLLELVRLEDGKLTLDLQPVDLRTFLPGLVSSLRGAAESSGLTLETHLPDTGDLIIDGDKDRLEKIFVNLVFNAIKFTPSGGEIHVRVTPIEGRLAIDVVDTGVGIAAENLKSVFGRFWQEDGSETRKRQGTGIGLALVKQLVELHGGTVSVTSIQGKGSSFRVQLNRSTSPAPQSPLEAPDEVWLTELYRKAQFSHPASRPSTEPASSAGARDSYKHTLLIVEDEIDMQRFLVSELQDKYNVILATDGYMGWEMAHQHQPKLILTDMMLPRMDGVALCRQLRSSPSLLPTKIVLLTARADDRTKLAALEAGADDFMTKPFSVVELKTRLANLLLTNQLERELQTQNQTLEQTLQQLRAAESQLIQNARLSALGSLSAGIMHEINNPVNFMLTAVHFLKTSLPLDAADPLDAANDIEDGLKRVRDIIADLKGFAYGASAGARAECSVEKVVRTARRLLATEIKEDVQLQDCCEPDARVYANENQLVQLLVNILQNAVQATDRNPARGKPRIVRVKTETDAQSIKLIIWDNGNGMKKEVQGRIFDPFFTTKEVGQGTGLGLSICHTIVKQHQGDISVESEEGNFTQFTVRLPLSAPHQLDASEPESEKHAALQPSPGR
jgi:signal transduction histidine kinase